MFFSYPGNVRNRQISYLSGTTAATYTYHPDNLRKTKTVNGATTNFVWADGNLVHEFTNTSTKTYFYAIILVSDSAGQAYLYNTHGDVIRLIGTLTWSYTYDAYGVQQNPDPLDGNAFRYAGQYFDTESGTYYLRARYYNPATGRFTQPDRHWNISNSLYGDDPLKLNGYTVPSIAAVMQSTNRYAYCMGNPVEYCDISGTFVISATVLIIIGCAALLGTVGGVIGNHIANKNGATGWEKAGYIAGGAVVGAAVGAAIGYLAAPAITSITAEGAAAATAASASLGKASEHLLDVPQYVHNAGSFMNWISGFEKHCVFTLDQIKQLISMAKEYGIEISADLAGHIGTEWPEAHLHFGNNRVHIAIAEEAIEWIKEILQ